jgi:hypothetical protein
MSIIPRLASKRKEAGGGLRSNDGDCNMAAHLAGLRFLLLPSCYVSINHDEIRNAVKLIMRSMREGGIFQVGRTVDNVNHASFFRKEGENLVLIKDVNNNAEMEKVISEFILK